MPAAAQTRTRSRALDGLAILHRRPKRYVPRHSTREPGPIWDLAQQGVPAGQGGQDPHEVAGAGPDALLRTVLVALDTVPEDGLAFDPAAPRRARVIDLTHPDRV